MRLTLAVAALLACASGGATPHTGTAAQEMVPPAPTNATLYLRTDGALDAPTRRAILAATKLLAIFPGATLTFAIEPRDAGAAGLAELLALVPDTTARLSLLGRLVDRDAPRWAQRDVLESVARTTLGSALATRTRPAAVQALLFRPARIVVPTRSSFELLGHTNPDDALLEMLARTDLGVASSAYVHARALGISGHVLVIPWRNTRDSCGPLEIATRLGSRVKIEIAAVVDGSEPVGVQLVAQALRRATPSAQLPLARLACVTPLATRDDAAWLLSAAGIDPMAPGLLDEPHVVPATAAPATTPTTIPLVDGQPSTYLDAMSLRRPLSVRMRLQRANARDTALR